MISEEKVKETAKRLRKGEPAGEIKESLKAEGYSDEDIKTAFPVHQYDMSNWYFFFGTVLLLAAVYLFFRGYLWIPVLPAALFILGFKEKRRVMNDRLSKMIDEI